MKQWTPAQDLAIRTRGRDLIVSAGAGAGKTSVLVERICSQLAAPEQRAHLDEFLVVTFTRAAAEEMRGRLRARIRELAREAVSDELANHLEAQLSIVPRARISTIHSFCLDLISAHAPVLGLPPVFDVMDEEEARLERREIILGQIEAKLAVEESALSLRKALRAMSGLGDAGSFTQLVEQIQDFLSSVPDPEARAAAALAPWEEAASASDWTATVLGTRIDEIVRKELVDLRSHCGAMLRLRHSAEDTASRRGFMAALDAFANQIAPLDSLARLRAMAGEFGAPAEFKFTKKRNVEDPLADYLRAHKDELRAAVKMLASVRILSAGAYFAPRATLGRLVLRDFGVDLLALIEGEFIDSRRLTFAMLERLALRLLTGDDGAASDIARHYQRQFKEVLVDEFQDTNSLQHAILARLLDGNAGPKASHRFVVGDIKQSIYGFREADPDEFLASLERSAPVEADASEKPGRIALTENFRSAHSFVGEINKIFGDLFPREISGIRYDKEHRLAAGRAETALAGARYAPPLSIELFTRPHRGGGGTTHDDPAEEFEDAESASAIELEATRVARRIREAGPPWKDIAVLVRSTPGTIEALGDALDAQGIPFYADARAGFLDAPEIREVCALLRTIASPFDDLALLAALRGTAGGWSENDLLRLRFVDRDAAYLDCLERAAASGGSRISAHARAFLDSLARWQRESSRRPMAEFVTMLADELHLVERAAVQRGGDRRRLHLPRLADLARQFDTFARKGLRRFLDFLDDMKDRDRDFAPPVVLAPDLDVVRIMTIHKAKGQEFPIVVLPFTGRKFQERDLHGWVLWDRDGHSAFRPLETRGSDGVDVLREDVRARLKRRARAEELRLLYVAITRARERLIITGVIADKAADKIREAASSPVVAADILRAGNVAEWLAMHVVRRAEAKTESAVVSIRELDELRASPAPLHSPPQAATADEAAAAAIRAIAAVRFASAPPPLPATLRAKVSVSEAKRAWDTTRDAESPPPARAARAPGPIVWRPTSEARQLPRGVAAGTATHRFLALCDFEAISRDRSLRDECARLVDESLLSADEAKMALLSEIARFLNSAEGTALRECASTLRREVPFTIAVEPGEILAKPASPLPHGPIILQGIVDAYYRDADGGLVLLDYKTDRGDADSVARTYTPQMLLYRAGLERALGARVTRVLLVVLRAGQAVEIAPRPLSAAEWSALLAPALVVSPEPDRPPAGEAVASRLRFGNRLA